MLYQRIPLSSVSVLKFIIDGDTGPVIGFSNDVLCLQDTIKCRTYCCMQAHTVE